MNQKEFIKNVQILLNDLGADPKLTVDGDAGPKTHLAMSKEILKRFTQPIDEKQRTPSWYIEAKKYEGKKETDPEFNKFMSGFWAKVGLPQFNTIVGSTFAWCGLAMSVALIGVGGDFALNGFRAKAWDTYGIEIDWKKEGIPQGAMVRINQSNPVNCKSASDNHIAQANGDCSPTDLTQPSSTVDLYGGNQGNTWKVSTYKAATICAVRWPKDIKDYPKPDAIKLSKNCTSAAKQNESTR